jgi:uncharacterized phiE125 gp8 family phage protein
VSKLLTTSTPGLALDLDDTKKRLILDDGTTDHDAIVTAMIRAATDACEAYSNHAFMQRTGSLYLDVVPTFIYIHDAYPLIEVAAIKYLDEFGNEQTLSTDHYRIDLKADPVVIYIAEAPDVLQDAYNIMWVELLYGHGAKDATESEQRAALPAWAIQAINTQVASMYENREDKILAVGPTAGNGNLIKASELLMHPYKRHW